MNQNTTNTKNTIDFDELHEECGVFGMYDFDGGDVASTIFLHSSIVVRKAVE